MMPPEALGASATGGVDSIVVRCEPDKVVLGMNGTQVSTKIVKNTARVFLIILEVTCFIVEVRYYCFLQSAQLVQISLIMSATSIL